MRKLFNLFAAALVMLAAASCEKNEVLPDNNSEGKIVTLKASINNGGTKTSLGRWDDVNSEYPVLWSEGDEIAVIQGSNVYKFTLKHGDGGKTSATFECQLADGFNPNGYYIAIYPYDCVSKEESTIKYTIPSNQVYVENSFASGSVPMVATGDDVLNFWGLSGALKLQLKGTKTIKSIEVVCTKNISGLISSSFSRWIEDSSRGNLEFDATEGKKWVKLDCGDGVELDENNPTDFIIAIGKQEYNALTIIVTDTDGNRRVLRNKQALDIYAQVILKMPAVNFDPQDGEYFVVEQNGTKTYYGAGIDVNGNTWAPVNCGYEPMTSESLGYTWGKFYQWNSANGLGVDGNAVKFIWSDTQVPGEDKNTLYKNWYNGEKGSSVVWTNNPCPDGWDVPTSTQLKTLVPDSYNYKQGYGQAGRYYSENALFLPFSGRIDNGGTFSLSTQGGIYWAKDKFKLTTTSSNNSVGELTFVQEPSCAYTIRCVKQ